MPETAEPALTISPTVVFHGSRDLPRVSLTFDACQDRGPVTGFDRPIIDILSDTGTPATLFLSGLWIRHHPQETAELAANPLFELGNHAWSHPDFERIDRGTMVREITDTQTLIARYTGHEPVLFRFPYGRYSATALETVTGHGLVPVQWDVEPGDPGPDVSVADILHTVERRTQNGSIIILHMNGNGQQTAEALAYVIRSLRQRGFDLVTVSQLLEGHAGPKMSGPVCIYGNMHYNTPAVFTAPPASHLGAGCAWASDYFCIVAQRCGCG